VKKKRRTRRATNPALFMVVRTFSIAILAPLGEHVPVLACPFPLVTNGSGFARSVSASALRRRARRARTVQRRQCRRCNVASQDSGDRHSPLSLTQPLGVSRRSRMYWGEPALGEPGRGAGELRGGGRELRHAADELRVPSHGLTGGAACRE
jgi:hypothetical protein